MNLQRSTARQFLQVPRSTGKGSSTGNGKMKADQLEIARLKREVIKLKAERDILKKAAAYFAKEST
jgi:transposase